MSFIIKNDAVHITTSPKEIDMKTDTKNIEAQDMMVLSSYTADFSAPTPTPAAAVLAGSYQSTIAQIESLRAVATQSFTAHYNNLYAILGKCYELYYQINTSERANKKQLLSEIDSYYQQHVRESSTTLHTQLVRLVFDECALDRRTVSRYASTLRYAFSSKRGRELYADEQQRILPEKFSYWLSLYGIDNAQRSLSSNKNQYNVEDALRDMREIYNLGTIQLGDLGDALKNTEFEYKIVIARWDSQNNTMVLCKVLDDERKVKALISPLTKQIETDYNSAQNNKRRQSQERKLSEAIDAVAAEAA